MEGERTSLTSCYGLNMLTRYIMLPGLHFASHTSVKEVTAIANMRPHPSYRSTKTAIFIEQVAIYP